MNAQVFQDVENRIRSAYALSLKPWPHSQPSNPEARYPELMTYPLSVSGIPYPSRTKQKE